MARWLIVLGILAICKSGVAEKYDNHTLLQVFPTSDLQLDTVRAFYDPDGDIEILKNSRGFNDSMDVLVPPNKMEYFEGFAKDNGLPLHVKERHYGRKMVFNEERSPKRRSFKGNPGFEYKSFSQINRVLENLEKVYPDVLELEDVGNTYQGRRMKLAKLSSNRNARNPIIFIDAGIHAREWVAPAMAVYIIHRLASDPAAREDLAGVDWYVLPVVNPDGYEYTRTGARNRLWRKTMSKSTDTCFGVDGNRNYGFKWAVSGVSHNPCDKETYAGPKPFSEVETQNVRKIMLNNANRIKLYVSMHSYGQYLVYPWGYTGDRLPREWRKLDKMARIVSSAVVNAGGLPFKVLSAGKWYPAAGGSDDFAFGGVGIPYSYTMELTDGHEFVFPQEKLPSTLPTLYEGFRAFAREISHEFGRHRRKREVHEGFKFDGLSDDLDLLLSQNLPLEDINYENIFE